ncbi:hypothetical protein SteCoe_6018 [Stentor coeruleus]|uniref:Uncharacterized protein n=1 Tax=Stentor coeruleus TaxID=5963 RepID=A0A1R2CR08_9CILI|nr:hypothetical protein SteCoe_6018 [Stentor coeruleus]
MDKTEISEKISSKMRFYHDEFRTSKKTAIKRLPKLGQKTSIAEDTSQINEKCLTLLNDLERLCDSYEQLPKVDAESEVANKRSSTIIEKTIEEPIKNKKLNFIINQLKLRIKRYPKAQAAYPASNRFKVISETEEKVGPGTYKSVISSRLETYEFSNIPRLHTPIAHTMHTIESIYKRKSSLVEDTIIRKNKLLAINPQQIREELASKINYFKLKEKYAKIKKQAIDVKQKCDKSYKLSEKLRKFEWRMTKEEVFIVQISWAAYISSVGMMTILRLAGYVRKARRIRSGRILRKFTLMTRYLARFLLLLSVVRKKIVTRRIMNLSVPFEKYAENDILTKKKMIQGIFDKSRDMPVIIHLMAKWKKNIVMIQRNIRNMKKISKARKLVLGMLWERTLESIQKTRINEKIHRSMTIDRIYIMPSLIKEKFIKRFMKDTFTDYAKERRIYAQTLKNLKNQEQNSKEHLVMMKQVKKPILVLLNQKFRINTYIEMANAYKSKIEKKQREIKYNLINPSEVNKSLTRHFK